MADRKYTVEDGIKVQTRQLAMWKQVLLKEVYEDLKFWVTWNNHLAECGHDVRTGDFMITFVTHYYPYYQKEVKEMKELLAKGK